MAILHHSSLVSKTKLFYWLFFVVAVVGFFVCFGFFFFAMPRGLWDLSSPTRDRTQAPAVKAPSPNHWTTREFLKAVFITSVTSKICFCDDYFSGERAQFLRWEFEQTVRRSGPHPPILKPLARSFLCPFEASLYSIHPH